MKVDGAQLNWTTESFQWQRLLKRRRIAFAKLCAYAEIHEGFVRPNNAEDWNRRAVVVLSGERCGEIMPMAFWFSVVAKVSRKAKLCSVFFTTEDEMLKFCFYGFSEAHKFLIKAIQGRSSQKVLEIREIASIDIPNSKEWHPVELYSQMADFNDKRMELLLCDVQAEVDAFLEKLLGLVETKDPLAMEIQWQFENHAHHVTGMRWDHARDFSPRSNLVESWVKSGIYEVRPLEDLFSEKNGDGDFHLLQERGSISLPRSIESCGINFAISLISELNCVPSRGLVVNLCEKINRRYAVYYLCSRITRLYLEGVSVTKRLQRSDFRSIPIAMPPIDEQKKIAAAIGDIVWRRSNREQEVRRLKDSIAEQVQKELFYE